MTRSPIERLLAEPGAFAPYPALRLLRRWLADEDPRTSRRVRSRTNPSLSPAPGEIESLRLLPAALGEAPAVELVAAFGSLLGVHGALPLHYTESLLERRDPQALAFVDLFQQRLGVLGEQVWRHGRLALGAETAPGDRLLSVLLALGGRGAADGLEPRAVAFHAGALASGRPSAATIEAVLGHYFDTRVQVQPWLGRWHRLPEGAQARLGLRAATPGHDATLGGRVWQRDLCVRVRLGPLARARYDALLPGGSGARALRAWWQALVGDTLVAELRLVLRAEDVCTTRLGAAAGARLGLDAFLPSSRPAQDRDDAGYRLGGTADAR